MSRKRKRTAWHATSQATATVFDPPHPAVEPTPPTPLVLRAEHVRAMQRALGLTPERASHALLLLPPAAERAARAMLPAASPKRVPRRLSAASAVTPLEPPPPRQSANATGVRAPTGASASPITPQPPPTARALFGAPATPTDVGGGRPEGEKAEGEKVHGNKPGVSKLQSLFSTASGKRLALPRAGASNVLTDVLADCAAATGAPRRAPQSPPAPRAVPPMALFTTASGKPVPPPPQPPAHGIADAPLPAFNTPRPRKPPVSLFTTASGKSVPVPSPAVAPILLHQDTPDAKPAADTTPAAAAANTVRAASANPHHAPVAAPFATPSPLPRPRPSHVPPSSAAKWNPSAAASNTANPSVSSSLFLSAAQSNPISVARPSNSMLDTRSASRSRSLPSPHTPSLPMHHLRKALFPESARNSSTKKSPHTLDTPLPRPTRVRRRRASTASTARTTPFKRPRRLRPSASHQSANNAAANQSNVPQFALPSLLTNGLVTCTNPHSHNCPTQSVDPITPKQLSPPEPSILQSSSLLLKCHDVIFRKHQFGHVSCLPPLIANTLNLGSIQQCDVSTFVQWTKQMFPAVLTKPASCVGSEAWTRMAYSLAVCKLLTLQSASSHTSHSHFFCAANVVREFLRRLCAEWHQSKQPHLLRIMRNDSSPSSHIVLRVVGIEQLTNDADKLSLVVSDGWYVARCCLDDTLQSRVWRGRVRVGDKVSVSGSTLQTLSVSRPFFFGEADELGASYLRVTANGFHKAPSDLRLGIRMPAITKSLKGILDGHGTCPPLHVVVLRTYPVFYRETVTAADEEDKSEIICRREEGEDEARSAFEEKVRRQIIASVEKQKKRGEIVDPTAVEVEQRCVSCVKDVLVCGKEDDPSDYAVRKLIRIYNAPESLHVVVKEGQAMCLTHVWPRPGIWICKPEAIRVLRRAPKSSPAPVSPFPRKICSVADLQEGSVAPGEDFDGTFAVLHVTPIETNNMSRFVYLTDDPGNEIRVLALELCDEDAKCLPRALRFRGGLRPRFPLLVVQDAQFKAISKNHDLVHAKTTLRSTVLSARAIRRQRKRTSAVKGRCEKVESHLRGKEEQLEILREAVVSFVSGETGSVGAYFTSTQDM